MLQTRTAVLRSEFPENVGSIKHLAGEYGGDRSNGLESERPVSM